MENSQNKLGTMPIGPLLVRMSVPMMFSMLVQALYNVVDSMFVARISENALTAVSLAFPFQSAMSAIAVGTGVGTNAFVSRSLGAGDRKGAEKAANVQCFLSACYTVFFMLLGLCASRGFFAAQTDVAEIVGCGEAYLSIVSLFCAGSFFAQNFEKLLISLGNSAGSMISQAAGALFNILFDWLLIFGVGPFPELGIRGAAAATVMGQFLSASIALALLLRDMGGLRFSPRRMLPEWSVVRNIYAVGVPSMLTVGMGSVMSFGMNQIILTFSTTAAAVFGVWLKLQSFGFMPVFGMNNGTIAIFSYNFGAGNIDRIRRMLRLALTVGITVTTAAAAVYELMPRTLMTLFDASDSMMEIGVTALRVCCVSLPIGAASIILSSSFQSLGRSRYTLCMNLTRQVLVQIPAAWLLSLSGRLELVWLAPLIAECAGLAAALVFNRKVRRMLAERFPNARA